MRMVAKRSEKTTLLFQTQPHHAHRHNKPEDLKLCVNLRSVGNSALPCVLHVRLPTNKILQMKLQPLASTTKLTGLQATFKGEYTELPALLQGHMRFVMRALQNSPHLWETCVSKPSLSTKLHKSTETLENAANHFRHPWRYCTHLRREAN